jgi:hypothetical protein
MYPNCYQQESNQLVTFLLAVPTIVALYVAAILARGFVLTILWGWFAVPVFGLPALSIAAAIGLTVLLSYLLNHTKESVSLGNIFIQALAALGAGYLIHLFM